jgi:hypothetical protein
VPSVPDGNAWLYLAVLLGGAVIVLALLLRWIDGRRARMSSDDPKEPKEGKGLQGVVRFWKITWPVWLGAIAGCGILYVVMLLFGEPINQWLREVALRTLEEAARLHP